MKILFDDHANMLKFITSELLLQVQLLIPVHNLFHSGSKDEFVLFFCNKFTELTHNILAEGE